MLGGRLGEETGKGGTMADSLRGVAGEVFDPQNLDHSVEEVMQMFGAQCSREDNPLPAEVEWVTAVVGLGGALSGACVLRSGGVAACKLAARMTGMEIDSIDDMVKDAVGEICNMLAGSWKSKVPELSARCGLSVPAVITGSDYKLHVQNPQFILRHVYTFDDGSFEVTILCDGIQ
jgi:chemotaxis protein CheX